MKITDEAKVMLEEIFKDNKANCLLVSIQESCCGPALEVDLAELEEGEEPITINGISVLMEEDAKEKAEKLTIIVEEGELAVVDEEASRCCG